MDKKNHFPLFCDVRGKKAVVVGGGNIALRRLKTISQFAFEITVISKDFLPEILEIPDINSFKKEYSSCDINGAFLVVAATDNREVNHRIAEDCSAQNIFVSVCDCAAECSFFFPAVALTDDLTVGITGVGNNHHIVSDASSKIRKVINNENN